MLDGRKRAVIENVSPQVDCGRYPIKRVVGEKVTVKADVFADGHDLLAARLLYRAPGDLGWSRVWMESCSENGMEDCFEGAFEVYVLGDHYYTVEAWVDEFKTWQSNLRKRYEAGQDLRVHLRAGSSLVAAAAARARLDDREELEQFAELFRSDSAQAIRHALGEDLAGLMQRYSDTSLASTYARELKVSVERKKALFSSWYEIFPRSLGAAAGRHGTFQDCIEILPQIRSLGFDVLYFPPIHPIGMINRKGKNNAAKAGPEDFGSPWAIGSAEGGHKAINPLLGTIDDFAELVSRARQEGIEIALDIAFQCAPDHPYVQEHPGWFNWLPDRSVHHAENPPKKYEDIIPFNFECEDWHGLWEELRSVFVFWAQLGVRIFRVDNPHTKPTRFWEWVIHEIKASYPDAIFLSEAFTRRKVMYALAKAGFSQSYTYFIWRTTKEELADYIAELTQSGVREYFRPNFWPNTPDILPRELQSGNPAAFASRLLLAATLSSNYGIYGPAYECCECLGAGEEYLHSEKYELRDWKKDNAEDLSVLLSRVNEIRREHPALHSTNNVSFVEIDNQRMVAYLRRTADFSDVLLIIVSLDPDERQSGRIALPLEELNLTEHARFVVRDLFSLNEEVWTGREVRIALDPAVNPGVIFEIQPRLERFVS